MRPVRLLALALLALSALVAVAAGAAPPALAGAARLAVVFALPFAAGVIASLLLPRSARRVGRSVRVRGTSRFHRLVLAAVGLDLAALGVAAELGWAGFTPSHPALEIGAPWTLLLALPLTLAVSTLGAEWALHARLWSVSRRRGRPREAVILALAGGVALALAPGLRTADGAFLALALATVLAREATALLLFRSGGLFVAGAYRGTLLAVDAFGVFDGRGLFLPLATYAPLHPGFAPLRVAGPLAALVLVAWLARPRGDDVT